MDALARLTSDLYAQSIRKEIDGHIGWIAQGFDYARNTGRLSGEIELRLRAMGRREARKLVLAAARDTAGCPTMGDVPRWLIRWHYGES